MNIILLKEIIIDQKRHEYDLNGLEVPKRIYYSTEEFSIQNDLLTPTFKLKRNEAKNFFIKEIREMYDGDKLQGE